MRQSKGKGVYFALMFLLVMVGFILQLNWMRGIREQEASEVDSHILSSKLGQWMLRQRGVGGEAAAPAGVETVECGACQGTGQILGEGGKQEICPICQGAGMRLIRRFDAAERICPACGGMGRGESLDTGEVVTCPRCGGRGFIRSAAGGEAAPDEKK